MAKTRPSKKPVRPQAPATPEPTARRWGEIDVIALVAATLCAVLAYLSRLVLSPDGVSYLDLTGAMANGDWHRFVQGYWSPLFPFVMGLVSMGTGFTGSSLVPAAHVMSALAAIAGIGILWYWGRAVTVTRPLFGRLAIAAFLLCSAGLPKIEAVTPDVVSLLLAVAISYQLLVHGGRRWLLTGLLLGAAFLAKTSAWPWLLVAVPLRIWAAPDAPARRNVWMSTATCAVVMLTWIVPMSVKAGHPTLGSSGRLNWSWYIDGTRRTQTPDGDTGAHAAYTSVPLVNGQQVTVATFDDAEHWTYQPWGDPTAWAENAAPNNDRGATIGELTGFWLKMFGNVFGLWLLPMIVLTIVPAFVLHHRPGLWGEAKTRNRDAVVVAAIGLTGLFQFVIIHPEPRLIAPLAIMLTLGTLWWFTSAPAEPAERIALPIRRVLSWLGMIAALGFAMPTFKKGIESDARLAETSARLDLLRSRLATVVTGTPTIAVVGPAAPILSAAYWSGVHVAMQIPPRSLEALSGLTTEQRDAALKAIFGGKVPMLWKTSADGGVEMLVVPR